MVESQVAIIPMVKAAAGRHGGPTVASYHCSQMLHLDARGRPAVRDASAPRRVW